MSQELEAVGIIEVFNQFAVSYVVIGAFAAIAQNVPVPPTMDIDFYAAPDQINLGRLSRALDFHGAREVLTEADQRGLAYICPHTAYLR